MEQMRLVIALKLYSYGNNKTWVRFSRNIVQNGSKKVSMQMVIPNFWKADITLKKRYELIQRLLRRCVSMRHAIVPPAVMKKSLIDLYEMVEY